MSLTTNKPLRYIDALALSSAGRSKPAQTLPAQNKSSASYNSDLQVLSMSVEALHESLTKAVSKGLENSRRSLRALPANTRHIQKRTPASKCTRQVCASRSHHLRL